MFEKLALRLTRWQVKMRSWHARILALKPHLHVSTLVRKPCWYTSTLARRPRRHKDTHDTRFGKLGKSQYKKRNTSNIGHCSVLR